MNRVEAPWLVGMGGAMFLGLGIMWATQVGESPPKPLSLSTPLPTPLDLGTPSPTDGLSNEECVSQSNALGFYLRTGFQESTGFDWMRARRVKADEIKVLSTCSDSFQGTVVEEKGINVRRIPYVNDAWLKGALNWGEEINFRYRVLVGKEEWGVMIGPESTVYDFNFFIIKDKDGREFVKVKNLPEISPDKGNFGQDQQGFPYGKHSWAKRLEKEQPPNPRRVRTGGRVFIA